MRPKHLFLLPHVDVMEPQPGGRWDVALAAERSTWRRANGLASGPTKQIGLLIRGLITEMCILYLVDDGGSVVTEFESLQTEQLAERARPDANVGRKNARRAHEIAIVKRNARIEAGRKGGNNFPSCVVPESQLMPPNIEYVCEAPVDVEPLVVQMVAPVTVLYRNDSVKEFIMPLGAQCVGLDVARDFGSQIGIFKGKITSVNTEGRRHYYHVLYEDGDEEDYDFEEMEFAAELHYKLQRGTYSAPTEDVEHMSDGEGSLHVPSDTEDESEMRSKKAQRKRKKKAAVPEQLQPKAKKTRVTGLGKGAKLKLAKSQHTITSLLEAYAPETEYGASIRSMNESDQLAEVVRLNKGVDKGTNLAIKSKLITAKYKELLAEKCDSTLLIVGNLLNPCLERTMPHAVCAFYRLNFFQSANGSK
jgi:hypothetical protein